MHNIGSCSQTWPTELDAASKSPTITNTPPPMALPSTARSTELLLAIGTGTGERYMSCTISESVARCALHFSAHVSSRSASSEQCPAIHPRQSAQALTRYRLLPPLTGQIKATTIRLPCIKERNIVNSGAGGSTGASNSADSS